MDFGDPTGLGRTLSAEAWWGRANALTVEHGLTRGTLLAVVRGAGMRCRPGLPSLLRACAAARTPVLVVSAGVADLIEPFLAAHLLLDEDEAQQLAVADEAASPTSVMLVATVALKAGGPAAAAACAASSRSSPAFDGWLSVSANKMVFDGGGALVGWLPAEGPCHSHNKALTFQREQVFFASCAARHAQSTHWLVLGDKPYDCTATHGLPDGLSATNHNDGRGGNIAAHSSGSPRSTGAAATLFEKDPPPPVLLGRLELRVGWFDGDSDGGRYTLADYAAAFDLVLPAHSALGLAPVQDLLRP
jgi:hypothetical protein